MLYGASVDTVLRRMRYGGKKGRAARRRAKRGWVWVHPTGGWIVLRVRDLPITREPIDVRGVEGPSDFAVAK